MHRARRLSAARAYLHPVLKQRRNLTLKTRAQADKILFEGNKAVGVQYRQGRFGLGMKGASTKTVTAKEVISCGGAFNSPQLLQLSGVGDRGHLEGLGIEVVSHLPASARTCRITSRSISSTPARNRCRSNPT